MSIRGWGWVPPALVILGGGIAGCNATSSDADSGGHWGGQTGSLQPCSTPSLGPAPSAVPTGDATVVFHTGCSSDTNFTLTNANGEPVPFALEPVDDGVVLLRTEESLDPGSYQVETPDGERGTVTVTEPVPLPSKLGSLRKDGSCGALFALTFDPAVEPYLPLMRLEYAVDGGERRVWFEYGTIATLYDEAWLEIPNVSHGDHVLEVFGLIAGETAGPDTAKTTFWYKPCTDDEAGDEGVVCSVGSPGAEAAGAGSGTALVLLGVALARRRRRR